MVCAPRQACTALFPACAGMNRCAAQLRKRVWPVPRVRGDEPELEK